MFQPHLNPYERIVWEDTPSPWMLLANHSSQILTVLFLALIVVCSWAMTPQMSAATAGFATPDQVNQAIKVSTGFLAGLTASLCAMMLWGYLVIRNTRYILTTERLFTSKGVFNKQIDELELYRVKDYTQYSPFLMRLVGLGCVHVQTSDRSHPYVRVDGIKNAYFLQGALREHTEICRKSRGVRELDT